MLTGIQSNKSQYITPLLTFNANDLSEPELQAILRLQIPLYPMHRSQLKTKRKELLAGAKLRHPSPKNRPSQKVRPPSLDLQVANSQNWRQIREQNPLYKLATFQDGFWTIDTTIMSTKAASLKLPAKIAGRPVILNHLPSIMGSFPYHPDPVNKTIDPATDIDDETLCFLFEQYPGARAACVYLNKTMVILHSGKFNRRAEFRKRPRRFGGLTVDHALFNRKYTAGPVVNDSRSEKSQSKKVEGLRVEIGSDGFGLSYSLDDGNSIECNRLRVGLRLRHKTNTGCEVLTMPVHTLFKAVEGHYEDLDDLEEDQNAVKQTPWYDPAEFLKRNGTRYKFNYHGDEFGSLYSHFEPKSTSHQNGDLRMLQHDIALIGELDKMSPNMRFPIFRHPSGEPIEMEWADLKEEDFMTQDIVLLGFNIELDAQDSQQNKNNDASSQPKPGGARRKYPGTLFQSGNVVVSFKDYEDKILKMNEDEILSLEKEPSSMLIKELKGGLEGRGYERGTKSTELLNDNHKFEDKARTLSYFQRSILWRPDFRRTMEDGELEYIGEVGKKSSGLLSIEGASGCPLALKTQRNGRTVYKIFGFQNSEHLPPRDDPELNRGRWAEAALIGGFHTYQSIRLPEDLTKFWDIVWELPTPKPRDLGVAPRDPDIGIRDISDIESGMERAAKRQRTTARVSSLETRVSKKQAETSHARKSRNKKNIQGLP
ncbi:hypothetical protein TWF506_002485 [Arthrobotrys conoides]|uniref:Uncharacterized protein n=1 Tax=Arthrobotrys conoides TaxID=74498 RepID=A0AAN8RJU2_9PEZI